MQRREHPRKPVTIASDMYFDDRKVPCHIKNISAGGAKLKIAGERENVYPGTTLLDITHFGRFEVTIVWRSGEHLGVSFHDAPDKMAEVLMAMAVY